MCDLFQANPWKPLLCTNCHQNRSGHRHMNLHNDKDEHVSSSSTMHLYEEIMAQYLTFTPTEIIQPIEQLPISNDDDEEEDDIEEDSFTDEEQELIKPATIEIIQNRSMVNTEGIVLIGPDLPTKDVNITKKFKKINLLKKVKSNADESMKKTDIIDNHNTSKSWWSKVKKASTSSVPQTELTIEPNKSNISYPVSSSHSPQQKVRVLPDINKLTLNEALNIARRQHSLSTHEPKLSINTKPIRSSVIPTVQSNYNSSIASTASSSTQSSNDYDTSILNNLTKAESTYLTAVSPVDNNLSLSTMFDKTNKLTVERITFDLRLIIDEYKQNLPVARFQTLKSFLHQHHLSKNLSNEAIYFLLLQILDEFSHNSIALMTSDHFLIAYDSTIPIIVPTTSSVLNPEESIEQFIKKLANNLFDSSSLPIFNDLATFESLSYRYLYNQILQYSNFDSDNNLSIQRVKLLNLFWNKIQSLRHIQINEDNERVIFALYYLMRYISQSNNFI